MDQSHPFSGLAATTGLGELTGIISRAGCAILAIDRSKVAWRTKPDRSPVSAADEAANAIIVLSLSRLLPGVPIVSEEDHNKPLALGASFVLVDPLDGTREFLAGRDEFTVNVALISRGKPIIGLIAAPALGFVWRGVVGRGAERLRLASSAAPQETTEIASLRARPPHRRLCRHDKPIPLRRKNRRFSQTAARHRSDPLWLVLEVRPHCRGQCRSLCAPRPDL
jgi:3'-phosphoadenosine 5'-phosphosulfate (PAPS) 3'-phosphatase